MTLRKILPLAVTAAFLLPAALWAQQSDPVPGGRREPGLFQGSKDKKKNSEDENVRSVAGLVSDPDDKPVSGAIVKLKDTKTLRIRSYITQEDGAYRFHGLSTSVDYELQADYNKMSSETRRLSVFDSRKEAVLNLKLEPAKEK